MPFDAFAAKASIAVMTRLAPGCSVFVLEPEAPVDIIVGWEADSPTMGGVLELVFGMSIFVLLAAVPTLTSWVSFPRR